MSKTEEADGRPKDDEETHVSSVAAVSHFEINGCSDNDDDDDDDDELLNMRPSGLSWRLKKKDNDGNVDIVRRNTLGQDDTPNNTSSSAVSPSGSEDDSSEEQAEGRARREAEYVNLDAVEGVTDPSLLMWCLHGKKTWLPCCVRTNHDESIGLDISITETNNVLVKFLGYRHSGANLYSAVPAGKLVPYYHESGGGGGGGGRTEPQHSCSEAQPPRRRWDPSFMSTFRRCIQKQKPFQSENDGEHCLKVETLVVQRALDVVVARASEEAAAAAASRARAERSVTQSSAEDDDDASDSSSEEEEDGSDDDKEPEGGQCWNKSPILAHAGTDDEDSKPGSNKRQRLRAGDVVRYYPPIKVYCKANVREATIVAAFPRSGISLELDDGSMLDVNCKVMLTHRYLRGKYRVIPKRKQIMQDVRDYTLDKSYNDKRLNIPTHADRIGSFYREAREEISAAQREFTTAAAETNNHATAAAAAREGELSSNATTDECKKKTPRSKKRPADNRDQKKIAKKRAAAPSEKQVMIAPESRAAVGSATRRDRLPRKETLLVVGAAGANGKSEDENPINRSNWRKRSRRASCPVGGNKRPTKKSTDRSSLCAQSASGDPPVGSSNDEARKAEWQVKLEGMLKNVVAMRKKSRFDKGRVDAEEAMLTVAIDVRLRLSDLATELSKTEITLIKEIARDFDVPHERLHCFLSGDENKLISNSKLHDLSKQWQQWLKKRSTKSCQLSEDTGGGGDGDHE